MGYVVKAQKQKEDWKKVTLRYRIDTQERIDPKEVAELAADGVEMGEIHVYLRMLKGRDSRRISDLTVEVDKSGKSTIKTGAVAREKCVRAVQLIEGLEDESGEAIAQIDHAGYDQIDSWILVDILREINVMNAQLEEEEGE